MSVEKYNENLAIALKRIEDLEGDVVAWKKNYEQVTASYNSLSLSCVSMNKHNEMLGGKNEVIERLTAELSAVKRERDALEAFDVWLRKAHEDAEATHATFDNGATLSEVVTLRLCVEYLTAEWNKAKRTPEDRSAQ